MHYIKKSIIFIKYPAQLALLSLLTSNAVAAVDYSLLNAPVNVNETVDIGGTQQLTETLNFSSEAAFVTALDNNLFDDASIYSLAGIDPFTTATFNIVGGNVTLTTHQGSGGIQMASSVPLFNQTFNGTTRNASSHLLKQWIDANAGLVQTGGTSSSGGQQTSPLNPIFGGGPASPVSFMPSSDAGIDINGGLSNRFLRRNSENDADQDNSVGISTRFSNYCTNQKCAQFYSLPVSFSKKLADEWALLFKLPLTYIDTNGVASYSIALSTGLRIPLSRLFNMGRFKWDVIPLFGIGGVSSDQPTTPTSLVYSGGLQSNFGFMISDSYSLIMQNQYTHFTTSPTSPFVQNGLRFNSDLINDIYRNGLQLAKEFNYQLFGRMVIASLFFADTRFRGDALAIDNQQEIGFDIGLKAVKHAKPADFGLADVASANNITKKVKSEIIANDIKLGITYTRAKNIDDAISANLGWTF